MHAMSNRDKYKKHPTEVLFKTHDSYWQQQITQKSQKVKQRQKSRKPQNMHFSTFPEKNLRKFKKTMLNDWYYFGTFLRNLVCFEIPLVFLPSSSWSVWTWFSDFNLFVDQMSP